MANSSNKLNAIVHQPTRLSILAALSAAKEIDFVYLRKQLALTDGNLSKHLQVLENAEFIKISKMFANKRPRTWISITKSGRTAFANEVQSLNEMIKQSKTTSKKS